MEVTREYTRKSDGLTFVRYGNENTLYCRDDDSGANDIKVNELTLATEFKFKAKYWED